MAALPSLAQLSGGNPVYDSYYRQVDPRNTGRVGAAEAAQFLKKSGLPDSTLGKIWELADPNGKGFLNKQGFLVALRLVGQAQSGLDVGAASIELPGPPPTFTDSGSPLLSFGSSSDSPWSVKPEEKKKSDEIFRTLSPVNGLVSGDKVKEVLINSSLPLDILGRVWDLSDVDQDGYLDRDEFAVAMHLVYRSLENEPVPLSLPPALLPPSKRKKSGAVLPGSVGVLPVGPAPSRESLHSPLFQTSGTRSPSPRATPDLQQSVNWVVPVEDRARYNDIFLKSDTDMDGLVGGQEVKEIFMKSGLAQATLACIWSLADSRQTGQLTKEQFSLAMHLIQQRITTGVDPPQHLTPDMVPPSERTAPKQDLFKPTSPFALGLVEMTGIKDLDDMSLEIAEMHREKYLLEQEIRGKEETISSKSTEVQEMQRDLDRETEGLQQLEVQKQDARERLEEMDEQRAKLEHMLSNVRLKYQEESQLVSSLQNQIQTQEAELQEQEAELGRAKEELSCLEQEETRLEQSVRTSRSRLDAVSRSLRTTVDDISQTRSRLSQIQASQEEVSRSIEEYNGILNGTAPAHLSETFSVRDGGGPIATDNSSRMKTPPLHGHSQDVSSDPFHLRDPFRDSFGSDPFRAADSYKLSSSDDFFEKMKDPLMSSAPFATRAAPPFRTGAFHSDELSGSTRPAAPDLFISADFADFSQMPKQDLVGDPFGRRQESPVRPPKKAVPPRPAPPKGWKL